MKEWGLVESICNILGVAAALPLVVLIPLHNTKPITEERNLTPIIYTSSSDFNYRSPFDISQDLNSRPSQTIMDEVAVASDGRSLTAGSLNTDIHNSDVAHSLFANYPLTVAFISFVLAQSLKIITTWYKEKRWDTKRLLGSGGMPSSHSAAVSSLAVAIGLHDGPGSSSFAIALVLACIVMYDAFGVRLHAGRQAEVLNQLVFELPAEHPLADTRPLREPLGHTPTQVAAGALLGFMIAYLMHITSRLSS